MVVILIKKKTKTVQKAQEKAQNNKLKKLVALGLLGVTVFSVSMFSITLFYFDIDFNIGNTTHVHNHVTDSFHTSHYTDMIGNRHYTVYPSRYGSLRNASVEVTPNQTTVVTFMSNPTHGATRN